MNKALEDPQEAFNPPEVLEDSLEDGVVRCIAFNTCGTILAAGLEDGKVALWDFEVRSAAKVINAYKAAVLQLAWSKDGRFLASAALDGSLALWNIETDSEIGRFQCEHPAKSLSICRKSPKLCLVSFLDSVPQVVNFETSSATALMIPLKSAANENKAATARLPGEGLAPILSRKGDVAYIAMPKGYICVISMQNMEVVDLIKVPHCTAPAINASLSKNGKLLLVNYQDNAIRAFEVCLLELPSSRKTHTVAEAQSSMGAKGEGASAGSVLEPESPVLKFSGHIFQDRVEKSAWKCAVPSSDLEYIAGASGVKNAYNIYIWTRWQRLDKVLEVKQGTGESVAQIAWHPCSNLLAAVTSSGSIHLWAQIYKENWSAFAPDFVELQENEAYIEPEDIFDINPKPEPAAEAGTSDMDIDVDILTLDKDTEMDSDGELISSYFHHLPVIVQPQEFDSEGKLLVQMNNTDIESPAISSKSVSEAAISLGEGEVKKELLPKGKHRLANVTHADEADGAPATDDDDEAMLSD